MPRKVGGIVYGKASRKMRYQNNFAFSFAHKIIDGFGCGLFEVYQHRGAWNLTAGVEAINDDGTQMRIIVQERIFVICIAIVYHAVNIGVQKQRQMVAEGRRCPLAGAEMIIDRNTEQIGFV
jgi:hypothetical protein